MPTGRQTACDRSLPTGTGKTVVFAHFSRVLRMKKRLIVLAHREELLLQARDKFRSIDPELKAEKHLGDKAHLRILSCNLRLINRNVWPVARAAGLVEFGAKACLLKQKILRIESGGRYNQSVYKRRYSQWERSFLL